MATAAVDNRQHLQSWQFPMPQHSRPSFQYAQAPAPPPAEAPLPARNEKELNRDMLIEVLTYFSTLIPSRFNGTPVRLVVHGGACMLLHPGLYALAQQQQPPSPSNSPHNSLPRRTTTRDVDYINRSFAYEWHNIGVSDATERLKDCMKATAKKFRLGLDWMNSDADVALPMANDPATGKPYDPIYTAAIQPNNVHLHTIFTSPNGLLTLVSVTPFWAVALKLVRYTKWDPGDICLLLRNGTNLSGTQWSPQMIESWLFQHCWPMGYSAYDPTRTRDMKARIMHAIQMLASWDGTVAHTTSHVHSHSHVTADAAMGASGDAHGWTSSNPAFFPPPPAQIQQAPAGWAGGSQHAQGPSTRKHNPPSLAPDDWQVPMPRPKSHSHSQSHSQAQAHPQLHRASASHSGWHPQAEAHVRQFDSHIESMLHASREGPALPVSTEPAVIPTTRRKRDKQRDADRKRDRLSKWFVRDMGGAALASDTEDSEEEWRPREKSRWAEKDRQEDRHRGMYQQQQQQHQQQLQQPQQQQYQHQSSQQDSHSYSHQQEQPASRSRPSQHQQHPSQSQPNPPAPAWHIYAQPHTTQPRPSQPLATIDSNRQARSRSANPRRQHRPPSLELEPLDELASSVNTLGIF